MIGKSRFDCSRNSLATSLAMFQISRNSTADDFELYNCGGRITLRMESEEMVECGLPQMR
jgi:hypothetical protein